MPSNPPSYGWKNTGKVGSEKKGDKFNHPSKFKQYTGKGKPKKIIGRKGKAKGYGKNAAKCRQKRGKQPKLPQKVSPVCKQDQPAFQSRLAEKTSRRLLTGPPVSESPKRRRKADLVMPRAGMPVPPAKYFGNPERMRLHEMKGSPINLETGNFDIHKRTVCVKGRPVQCLQVLHPKARSFEFDGYIPWLMRPVPVQAIMGYSSRDKDKPSSSHPHEVVVNWWQVFAFLVSLVQQHGYEKVSPSPPPHAKTRYTITITST